MEAQPVPHSPEAEAGLLGAVLVSGPDAVDPAVELGMVAEDFYDRKAQCVWSAIVYLYDNRKPIDIITVAERVDDENKWPDMNYGVRSYLSSVSSGAGGSSLNAPYYSRLVKDKSVRRNLISSAGQIAQIAYDESTDIETAIDRSEKALKNSKDKAPSSGRVPVPDDIIARLEGLKSSGIQTRWSYLNKLSTGMTRGHLWVIGGFTSTGKSAVLANLLDDTVRAGGSAMVASTEMSQEQYMLRLLSITSGVPQRNIRHGGMTLDQSAAYTTAKTFWKTAKVRIHDDLYNVTRIRRMARRAKEQLGDLDVIFVDFLQNLNETGDEVKDARVSIIELQKLAKDMNVCVVALSQISNAQAMQQQETGAMGSYYSFKGSGAISHAADLAIMLDRDRVNAPAVMWFNIVKNRHDSIGRFACKFELETGGLVQMTMEEQDMADPNSGRKRRGKSNDD